MLHSHLPKGRGAEPAPRSPHHLATIEEPLRLPGQPGRRGARRQRGEVRPERQQITALGKSITGPLRPAPAAPGEHFCVIEERQQDFLVSPAAEHRGGGLFDLPAAARRRPHVRDRPGGGAEQRIRGRHGGPSNRRRRSAMSAPRRGASPGRGAGRGVPSPRKRVERLAKRVAPPSRGESAPHPKNPRDPKSLASGMTCGALFPRAVSSQCSGRRGSGPPPDRRFRARSPARRGRPPVAVRRPRTGEGDR